MLSIGERRLSAPTAIAVMIVEQLGLAMMPGFCFASSPLISGTTSGMAGSMRKAELLSMYTAPLFTMAGAKARDMPLFTAPRTKSIPSNEASVASSTVSSCPRKGILLPALRALERSLGRETGIPYSSSTLSISRPTAPVAPRMAMLQFFIRESPFCQPVNPSYNTRIAFSKSQFSTPTMMESSSAPWAMVRIFSPCSPSA